MIEIHQDDTAVELTCRKVFECELPLRFGDMDADGHVNNAEYYRFMEEARMRWVHSLQLAVTPPAPIPVVAASACAFRASMRYPSQVKVEIYLGKMGRSSVRAHYLLRSPDGIAAEGYAVSVWIDPATHKSIALPQAVRALAA